ncbi:hypothetical protein F5J12DRAFT_906851 [Pisolithus orientalis]|uniref:uncharacterized protein n=1 Tax=Pisolithus orientalis TaxID=936130 RepID=UPI002224B927|nr:uncharacterized protein F5J12DRAFT_906851 [Pisolithus orientalis]KAI5998503.1 hypothetical protein F5J12DRAFT_906851 [Pisolithus orientalis]
MAALWVDLWWGKFDCTPTNNKSSWYWAIFKDRVTWEAHGLAITSSFDIAPCNPSTEYITWIHNLCLALLYGVLPVHVWRNFCNITPTQLCHTSQLILEWAPEFEHIFYQHCVDCIPFIHPCVHLTSCVGSPICSSHNLGQEIWQPSDPFSNLAQQGICCCQVNALKAMLPHLDPPENVNLHASSDLHYGYHLITLQGAEA